MKIGLYIEHGIGNGVGGAELMMAHLASAWSHQHSVDLIHHRPPLTQKRFQLFSEDDFSHVTFRYVPREREPESANPMRRYAAARDWHKAVSEGYDLFVNCTHWLPCFSHARKAALLVLFPFYVRPEETPAIRKLAAWKRAPSCGLLRVRMAAPARDLPAPVRDLRILPSMDGAPLAARHRDHVSAGRCRHHLYSERAIDLECRPFLDDGSHEEATGNDAAFRQLHSRLSDWRYASVGGLNAREENHEYFERVRRLADGYPALVEANLERPRIKELFGRARVFWHATGLGEDPNAHPELAEHFGIATVEAMAAGCVPVVINRGGQANIVEHEVNGFLWNTVEEMLEYTERLAGDATLWTRMSQAAKAGAAQFSRAEFIRRMTDACLGS